jgi:hypothetical protein
MHQFASNLIIIRTNGCLTNPCDEGPLGQVALDGRKWGLSGLNDYTASCNSAYDIIEYIHIHVYISQYTLTTILIE